MKKIYIITGAGGFLGNYIVRLLQGEDREIRCLLLPGESDRALQGLDCSIYRGDVTDPSSLGEVFSLPEGSEAVVIHCAAIVSIKTRQDDSISRVNVDGTGNVAAKALETGSRMVYINTVHSIPEGEKGRTISEISFFHPEQVVGEYAKTKARAANLVLDMVRTQGLDAVIIQPSGIIGPNDFGSSHLTQLILDCAHRGLRAGVRGGYDFVDVRDVAKAVLTAGRKGRKGQCYILSGRYVSVRELLDMITGAGGFKPIRCTLPLWFANLAAPMAELYYQLRRQPPLFTRYSLYTLNSNSNFSNEKARLELDFEPRNIAETVKDTVEFLRRQGRI